MVAEQRRQQAPPGRRLAEIPIGEAVVEEVYWTSVGGVARIRARGHRYLVREGDRLADGEVDTIGFATPTVAWVRFRRRATAVPHLPYHPVAWLLAGDEPRPVRVRPGSLPAGEPPGSAVGRRWNRRLEVHRLEAAEPAVDHAWRSELTVEGAPRLFVELVEEAFRQPDSAPDPFAAVLRLLASERHDGNLISWTAAFGSVEFGFTSDAGILGAVADELGIRDLPPPAPRPAPPPLPPAPPASGPTPPGMCGADLDCLLEEEDEEGRGSLAYDPGWRPDPFRDLSAPWLGPRSRSRYADHPRPEGIAGLLVDEIEVDALFVYPETTLAEVRTRSGRYRLRPGARIYDADVTAIDADGSVTFRQIVRDPSAPRPFQEVVRRVDPRWIGAPSTPAAGAEARTVRSGGGRAGPRDPFGSLDGAAAAARRPSSLAQLECDDLTLIEPEPLGDLLDRADRRLASYLWERSLADRLLERGGSDGLRRYLDDVAQAAGHDLSRWFAGELPGARSILDPFDPPPAEMFALLGDLHLIAGRPGAAAEAYRVAERIDPGHRSLCGRLHGGRLYGAESVPSAISDGYLRVHWLTGYLLAWDAGSGRVLERHLLPGLPKAFTAEGEALRIGFPDGGSVRLAGSRLEPAVRVPPTLFGRYLGLAGGAYIPSNFVHYDSRGTAPFAVGREIDHRLPLTPPELEEALRAAAARDPTQPWHRFFLGQALWAQGRREEAAALWRTTWRGSGWEVPYYELLWMATFHEDYGQPEWADRLYGRALAERRRLAPAVATSRPIERDALAADWLSGGPGHDPERRYQWWRRLREIAGAAPGDAFRAALWADYWARRGDRARAREELAFVERAREDVYFDLTARSAWIDYGLYLVVAVVAMLAARLAVLAGRLARRPRAQRRPRSPGEQEVRGRTVRTGVELLALSLALHVALSLVVFAVSHLAYLRSLPFELSDAPPAEAGQAGDAERFRLIGAELFRAWLARGAVEPVRGSHGALVEKALEIRRGSPSVWLLAAAVATAALLAIALPAGLFLAWGPARRVVTRWVPGASHARAGADFRGALVFGLFVFAAVPLSWLAVARGWGAVPAPGPVSANFFLHAGLEEPLLPPAAIAGDADGRSEFERLRAASFRRLLAVYPGAKPFWSLVLGALAVSLAAHASRPRPGSRGVVSGIARSGEPAPGQGAASAAGLSSGRLWRAR